MAIDAQSIDTWCRDVLGAGVASPIFAGGHLAQVLGVELDDGREVVVKIRPAAPRLSAVVSIQRHLHDSGVPCPRPLAGPLPFGGQAITAPSASVVGHADWEAHNMGWHGQRPIVIYDWDSLAIRPEPVMVGAAATVFAATTGTTIAASVNDAAVFLDSYQRRRGRLHPEHVSAAWAAGLWTLLYNAKKETAGGGGGYLRHLET